MAPNGSSIKQHRRVGAQRTGDAHTLLLSAGQLARVAISIHRGVEPDEVEQLVDAGSDPGLLPAEEPRHGADVGADRLMREEADALDHVTDSTAKLNGIDIGDVVVIEKDTTRRRLDETVDHAHRGRLATAGGTDKHTDLAVLDLEAEVVHSDVTVGIALRDVLEPYHQIRG